MATDKENDAALFERIKMHKTLALDGWSRLVPPQDGAHFSKKGKYLNAAGDKVTMAKPKQEEKPAEKPKTLSLDKAS